jgi:hypothetical protein
VKGEKVYCDLDRSPHRKILNGNNIPKAIVKLDTLQDSKYDLKKGRFMEEDTQKFSGGYSIEQGWGCYLYS